MTKEISGYEFFLAETAKSAVEDTGCIKAVPRKNFFLNCLTLGNPLSNKKDTYPSNTPFKFGNGRKVLSI